MPREANVICGHCNEENQRGRNELNALDSYSHKGAVVVGGEYSNVLGAVVGGAE
jgi:hypothetical protein